MVLPDQDVLGLAKLKILGDKLEKGRRGGAGGQVGTMCASMSFPMGSISREMPHFCFVFFNNSSYGTADHVKC